MEPSHLLILSVVCLMARFRWRVYLWSLFGLIAIVLWQPSSGIPYSAAVFPILTVVIIAITWRITQQSSSERQPYYAGAWIIFLVSGLLILKIPDVALFLSRTLYHINHLDPNTATLADLQWLGLAYIVLRLVAMLIDYRKGQLPRYTFWQTLSYVIFPPSLLAGPIERIQHFVEEMQSGSASYVDGSQRIVVGMVKKYIIADSLAIIALSPQLVEDTNTWWAAWGITYIYALQIFFDFSGYSDMAIGLGKLAGINLPENFNRPYLRQNLTLFWQNWHMSLTGWFRTYVFIPFSRYLIRRKLPISDFLLGQVVTMLLIGAWHGVTVNFLLWGLWHAFGLYALRQITTRTRTWYLRIREVTWQRRLSYTVGMITTFHYVVIGWVFFALPDLGTSIAHLQTMFGL